MSYIKNEVPMVAALITAAFAVAVSFGVNISSTQQAAILGLEGVIAGLITRAFVTPKP